MFTISISLSPYFGDAIERNKRRITHSLLLREIIPKNRITAIKQTIPYSRDRDIAPIVSVIEYIDITCSLNCGAYTPI